MLATFPDLLSVLVDLAKTYYSGEEAGPDVKVAAIVKAYAKVGITVPSQGRP